MNRLLKDGAEMATNVTEVPAPAADVLQWAGDHTLLTVLVVMIVLSAAYSPSRRPRRRPIRGMPSQARRGHT